METLPKLKDILIRYSGAPDEDIRDYALIEEDLGITGDDAWELMEELGEKLNVDFSGFEFTKHFSPEAGRNSEKEYGYYPISVGHLAQVIEVGRWVMPPRNEENFVRSRKQRKRRRILQAILLSLLGVGVWVWRLGGGSRSCE